MLGSEEAETACPLSANKGKKAHGHRYKMSCRNLGSVLGPPGPLGDGQLDLSFQGDRDCAQAPDSLELWAGMFSDTIRFNFSRETVTEKREGLPRPSRRDEAWSTSCSPGCSSLLTKLLNCYGVLAQAA